MAFISKATSKDSLLLADIGRRSFIESHKASASPLDIKKYVNKKYTNDAFQEELNDPNYIYHIIYLDQEPAGYSKIIFNSPDVNIPDENITKLDRIYLFEKFYGLKLGYTLLNFNLELSQKNDQSGMWLFVWKGNLRAVDFYERTGFNIIGSNDFMLTETHSNPNHQMLLKY